MPRYWVCNRCGTYNLRSTCETCGLSKEEGIDYETIEERDPIDEDDYDFFDITLDEDWDEDDDWDEW